MISLIRLTRQRKKEKWAFGSFVVERFAVGEREYNLLLVALKLIMILPLMQTSNCFVKDHKPHFNFFCVFPLAGLN